MLLTLLLRYLSTNYYYYHCQCYCLYSSSPPIPSAKLQAIATPSTTIPTSNLPAANTTLLLFYVLQVLAL